MYASAQISNPGSQTDPRGLITTYSYDNQGNVASIMASDGGVTTNTYDSLNRLETTTDPLGRKTTFVYDDADHVLCHHHVRPQVLHSHA